LSKLKRQFAELTTDEAARLLKLWNVRTVSPSSKTH
jgi:hypothetical protein